jgi:hypothetical protein
MQRFSPYATPGLAQLLPAWAFSALIHLAGIVLLGMAVQQAPRGAAEAPLRSAGIVLKRTSAEGDLYEGEEQFAPSAAPPTESVDQLPEPAVVTDRAEAPNSSAPAAGAKTATRSPNAGRTAAGGRRGSPAGGGQARVSVFGVEGAGSRFVYLFDRSSSMEGPPLAAAKRQLIDSLKSLESKHQFHIIFFNARTQAFEITGGGRRIAFATERNKQLAANFVGGFVADGGTDRLIALREALAYAPDVIFFLTDSDNPMSPSELADIARANRRAQTAICVIEFGRGPAPTPGNFLSQLAGESGGQYGYVNASQLRE